MSATTQFGDVFKNEDGAIRDLLLNLIQAFCNRDVSNVRRFLNQAAALSGSHFRYEEGAFYPALIEVLDEKHVQRLLSDDDRAIDVARSFIRLAAWNEFSAQDAESGARSARSLLPHVFECDGLSIMARLLPGPEHSGNPERMAPRAGGRPRSSAATPVASRRAAGAIKERSLCSGL
jgi:hypothetical protein